MRSCSCRSRDSSSRTSTRLNQVYQFRCYFFHYEDLLLDVSLCIAFLVPVGNHKVDGCACWNRAASCSIFSNIKHWHMIFQFTSDGSSPTPKFPARGLEQDRVDVLRSRWPPVAYFFFRRSLDKTSFRRAGYGFFPIWDLRVLVMLRRLCHVIRDPVSRGLRFFPLGMFLAEVIGVADPMFFTHERDAE